MLNFGVGDMTILHLKQLQPVEDLPKQRSGGLTGPAGLRFCSDTSVSVLSVSFGFIN